MKDLDKTLKVRGFDDKEEKTPLIRDLDSAIIEQKKIKRLIDLFIFGLFLLYIMYTFL